MALGDNPIYLFRDADGQDLELFLEKSKVVVFVVCYNVFPLKWSKIESSDNLVFGKS